jgi:hypothetical protein
MSEPTQLLPCPFCGTTNITVAKDPERETWDAYCQSCYGQIWDDDRKKVIAAWNTRALDAERDTLRAELGKVRMCVNCGKTIDASSPRQTSLPTCENKDGMSACTFDMTPAEAVEFWRVKAHMERTRAERAEAELAEARALLRQWSADYSGNEDADTKLLCARTVAALAKEQVR